MAKGILQLIIQVMKEGNGDKDTIRALVDIKGGIAEATVVMGALAGVGYTLNQVYENTVKVFEDYALQVSDLSRLTGMSMEDSSRMIQLADDMRISYEGLQKALWFASKNGVEVNIDSLAALADKYNGFSSATERATFLAKTFGKGGEEMGKLLTLGADGVRQLSAAIEPNLVLTAESRKKALDYSIALDELSDKLKGAAVSAGQVLAPALNNALNWLGDANRAVEIAHEKGEQWTAVTDAERAALLAQAVAEREATTALKEKASALGDDTTATDEAAAATAAYKAALDAVQTEVSGPLGTAYEDHAAKLKDLNDQMAKARKPAEKKDIQAQIDAETAAYERQTNAIIYNIQAKGIEGNTKLTAEQQAGALTSLALAYGLIDSKTATVISTTATWNEKLAAGQISVDQYVQGLSELGTVENEAALAGEDAKGAMLEGAGALGGAAKAATEAGGPIGVVTSNFRDLKIEANDAANEEEENIKKLKKLDGMTAYATLFLTTVGSLDYPKGFTGNVTPSQGKNCFVAGTPVRMADGTDKPIEQVQVGGRVLSYDVGTGEFIEAAVETAFHHEASTVPELLSINGGLLIATPEHPFWVRGDWRQARELVVGDELQTVDLKPLSVTSLVRMKGHRPVFNLHTDHPTHNYFVNGVLVHNFQNKAAGGQWVPGMWALVGDEPGGKLGPYTESIDPQGYIHTAEQTRVLYMMGMLRGAISMYTTAGSGPVAGAQGGGGPAGVGPGGQNIIFHTPKEVQDYRWYNPASDTWLGGSRPGNELGSASLADAIAPIEQSTQAAGTAAKSAALAADSQARASTQQTQVLQLGNQTIADKLDELIRLNRDLPQAIQDAVKLVV